MKAKELLSLEPNKIYIMKYERGCFSDASVRNVVDTCYNQGIRIIPIEIAGSIDKLKFEEKYDTGRNI